MELKTRLNYRKFDLPSWCTEDHVMLLDGSEQCLRWLGTIDRVGARALEGAIQAPLDISGWRRHPNEHWQWVPAGMAIVGCAIDRGVFAVLDGDTPLLKSLNRS